MMPGVRPACSSRVRREVTRRVESAQRAHEPAGTFRDLRAEHLGDRGSPSGSAPAGKQALRVGLRRSGTEGGMPAVPSRPRSSLGRRVGCSGRVRSLNGSPESGVAARRPRTAVATRTRRAGKHPDGRLVLLWAQRRPSVPTGLVERLPRTTPSSDCRVAEGRPALVEGRLRVESASALPLVWCREISPKSSHAGVALSEPSPCRRTAPATTSSPAYKGIQCRRRLSEEEPTVPLRLRPDRHRTRNTTGSRTGTVPRM